MQKGNEDLSRRTSGEEMRFKKALVIFTRMIFRMLDIVIRQTGPAMQTTQHGKYYSRHLLVASTVVNWRVIDVPGRLSQ